MIRERRRWRRERWVRCLSPRVVLVVVLTEMAVAGALGGGDWILGGAIPLGRETELSSLFVSMG